MSGRDSATPRLSLEAPGILRGGARVSVVAAGRDSAAQESTSRPVRAEDSAGARLFQPRLIEFGETREETTVSVRPVVREELVVGRTEGRRVERIEETVRRTEVEVEALPDRRRPEDPALERGS